MIEVLLLHRHLPGPAVEAGLTAALSVGSCSPDVVAVEARKAAQVDAGNAAETGGSSVVPNQQVISLTERRLVSGATLPADARDLPTVDAYDQLLTTTRRRSS